MMAPEDKAAALRREREHHAPLAAAGVSFFSLLVKVAPAACLLSSHSVAR
jgi:hypothetical protein